MIRAESVIDRYLLRDDGIVVGTPIPNDIHRTTAVVRETLDVLRELIGPGRRPGLWDPRGLSKVYPEGWVVLIERIPDMISALAILVDDGTERLLGGFPEYIDALLLPTRLFRDEDEAFEWLQEYLD